MKRKTKDEIDETAAEPASRMTALLKVRVNESLLNDLNRIADANHETVSALARRVLYAVVENEENLKPNLVVTHKLALRPVEQAKRD